MGDYGFWLYSAMTQATAALFGVIGMFIIFKLQSLKDNIKDEEKGVLDALHRIGLNYSALEKKPFKEIEGILTNEIRQREETEKIPDEEAGRLLIDKTRRMRENDFLKSRRDGLKAIQSSYSKLLREGKGAMKGLGLIFGFSVVLLMVKPLLGKASLVSLTILYGILLSITSIKMWHLMIDALESAD